MTYIVHNGIADYAQPEDLQLEWPAELFDLAATQIEDLFQLAENDSDLQISQKWARAWIRLLSEAATNRVSETLRYFDEGIYVRREVTNEDSTPQEVEEFKESVRKRNHLLVPWINTLRAQLSISPVAAPPELFPEEAAQVTSTARSDHAFCRLATNLATDLAIRGYFTEAQNNDRSPIGRGVYMERLVGNAVGCIGPATGWNEATLLRGFELLTEVAQRPVGLTTNFAVALPPFSREVGLGVFVYRFNLIADQCGYPYTMDESGSIAPRETN